MSDIVITSEDKVRRGLDQFIKLPPINPCKRRSDGTYASGKDCSTYLQGFSGLAYHMTCPRGTVWNHVYRRCTFPVGIYSQNPCNKVQEDVDRKEDGKQSAIQDLAKESLDGSTMKASLG